MAKKDYYETLGINKNSTEAEIKKAYRKKAMEWHPDKHKGDKKAEEKFKEINEAYENLKDPKKRKQYDTFGQSGSGFSGGQHGFGGFEDIFSQFGQGTRRTQNSGFEFEDLFDVFGNTGRTSQQYHEQKPKTKKEDIPNVDVVKTYEVPIMDLILGTKLDIETVYSEHLKLKIPEGTKPGTKFKVAGKGRKIGAQIGDMFVIVDAKMPKDIPEDVKKLLESIKYRL